MSVKRLKHWFNNIITYDLLLVLGLIWYWYDCELTNNRSVMNCELIWKIRAIKNDESRIQNPWKSENLILEVREWTK